MCIHISMYIYVYIYTYYIYHSFVEVSRRARELLLRGQHRAHEPAPPPRHLPQKMII